MHLGAHIDGFAAISAETLVVGASASDPVTGRKADVIKAAWHAAELAMRTVKVGNKNWAVTEVVGKTVATWDCKPVEGKLFWFPFLWRCLGSRLFTDLVCLCFRHAFMPTNSKCY